MQLGDLIKFKDGRIGIVVRTLQKKVWETSKQGRLVNWDNATQEPHVEIMFSGSPGTFVQLPIRAVALDTMEVIPCKKETWSGSRNGKK